MSCASVGKVLEVSDVKVWVFSDVQIFGNRPDPSCIFYSFPVFARGTSTELRTTPQLADRLGDGRGMLASSLNSDHYRT